MKTRKAALFTTITLALVVACGGNKPEPTTSVSPPVDPGSGETAVTPTSPSATSEALPSPPMSVETNDVAGASPATLGPPAGSENEMKDECTPVGVDFEKRARPKLKECYAAGTKKDPNLEGTVKIKITVDVKGKIKATKIVEKTLPDAVADCMLKVVKTTPLPEADKCADGTLTIPVTFPTPR